MLAYPLGSQLPEDLPERGCRVVLANATSCRSHNPIPTPIPAAGRGRQIPQNPGEKSGQGPTQAPETLLRGLLGLGQIAESPGAITGPVSLALGQAGGRK